MKTLNSLDSLGSLDSKGVLHAPMAAVLLVLTMTTLMIFGYFHHWRKLVEVQLKLDNCVADVAQDLRWNLNFIESTNLAMKSVRILIPPSLIVPGTTAVLKDALLALEFAQKGILGVWQVKRNVYRVKCRFFGPSDHLPDMSWERPLPDVIGQNALTWKEGSSKELEVQLVE